MFFAGDGTFRFRFTGTRGMWRFETTAEVSALKGFTGQVQVTGNDDPHARAGFWSQTGATGIGRVNPGGALCLNWSCSLVFQRSMPNLQRWDGGWMDS